MTTIPRPLSPDALAGLRSVAEVCEALRVWGRPDLAERIPYFASDEDLDDGDVPLTPRKRPGLSGLFRGGGNRRESTFGLYHRRLDLRRVGLS